MSQTVPNFDSPTSPGNEHARFIAARWFLALFLPLALLVVGGAWFIIHSEMKHQEAKWRSDEMLEVQRGQGAMAYRLQQVAYDVKFLSNLPSLRDNLTSATPASLEMLAQEFKALVEAKKYYDQVRWLDETGQERVRVDYRDGKAKIVSQAALQDKSGRYYFRDAVALTRGQVYFSPLDLNVEHDRIEVPYRPMIRIGTPVFDQDGHKRGIVLLNYQGEHLLERFRALTSRAGDRIMLLNSEGFWLAAPNPADEWGFMFGAKENFATRYSWAWEHIRAEESGQFREADGLWSFSSVHPAGESSASGDAKDRYVWKVVSHLPENKMTLWQGFLPPIVLSSMFILLLLALFTVLLIRARVREHATVLELRTLNSKLSHEVAERTHAEQLARKHEAYLLSLVQTAPDAIIVIDGKGKIELCNQTMENLFGYRSDEVMGQNINFLMPEPYRSAHDGYLHRYMSTGEAHVIGTGREIEGQAKDGRRLPLFLKIGEMGKGEERRFIGFLQDISDRKRVEIERERYLAELERSNRELDDFGYITSHDLKEPLRGIHNYACFVLEDYADLLPPDGREKLQTLTRLASRMENLINDLLYYSRVGRWELNISPVDMNAALEHARESLAARLEECGGQLVVPRLLPPALGDSTRIPAIFQNLVGNALKYNDQDEKRIEIGWLDEPPEDHPVPSGQRIYYVRDNGIGIRPQHLDSVFRIFKRLHGRDQYGGGSGVGLTITRKLVQRLGGDIWVQSVYGEGSTFYFSLPATKSSIEENNHES